MKTKKDFLTGNVKKRVPGPQVGLLDKRQMAKRRCVFFI